MKKRALPILRNRKNPLWGKCDLCGHEDILSIEGNSTLYLLCSVCVKSISFVIDVPDEGEK